MLLSALSCVAVLAILLAPYVSGELRERVGAVARTQDGRWVVLSVASGSIASKAGLRPGDVVLALDGITPSARLRTDPDLDFGLTNDWTVLRNGEQLLLQRSADAGPGYPGRSLIWLTVALTFWGIATFVLIRKPQDPLVRRLYRLNMTTAIVLALIPAVETDVIWAKVVEVVGFGMLPGLFVDLFLTFALGRPLGRMGRVALRALYLSGVVSASLYLTLGFLHSDLYDSARVLLLTVVAAGFIWGLAALARAYQRPSSSVQRQQVQIILLGAAAAVLPVIIVSLLPVIVGQQPLIYKTYAPLCAVFLPISIAYAILWRGFLSIDMVERTIVYGVMTLLLGACYALLLYGLGFAGYSQRAESNPILLVGFFATVTLTFIPVRDRIHRLIDHFLYRDRYDYASTLKALGNHLSSLQPIDEVLAVVVNSLAGAMNLTGAAVLLKKPDGELAMRAASGAFVGPELGDPLLVQALSLQGKAEELFGAGRCIPIIAHGETSGLLYLGRKRSPAELSLEDLNMAETIASQIAVAVANALLFEQLQTKVGELELLRDQLLHVQEEERKRLAQNLHDGPLHSTMDLVRQAEAMIPLAASSFANDQSRHHEQLFALAERGRDVAHELRSVCSDLYPSELGHLGLAAALESLARRINREEDLSVRFVAHSFPLDLRLGEDVESTMYRVAREALDNACRHSEAKDAELTLDLDKGKVVMAVRDNGCGFVVPASFGVFLRNGHLGLASLRERVERIGGVLSVRSARGEGTEIRVQLPVSRRMGGEKCQCQLNGKRSRTEFEC